MVVTMIVDRLLAGQVECRHAPPEVQVDPGITGLPPDALEWIAFPERLGERWTVVWRVGLGADDADSAIGIERPDAAHGGIGCHAAANDEVAIGRHGGLRCGGNTRKVPALREPWGWLGSESPRLRALPYCTPQTPDLPGKWHQMALLGMQEVSIVFGGPLLLDHAGLSIERGERVCLLGRNGAGKSTVLKLLDGTLVPDTGEVVRQTGVVITRLEQEVPDNVVGTTFDVVAAGLGDAGLLLARYHAASHRVELDHTDAAMRELTRLHDALDRADAWQVASRVDTVLDHLGLDPDAPFASASGGRKRQALLARALVREPDVLLLDEPTNHLDVAAVEWMEDYLIDRRITLVFVTHDRAFLRRVATRIVELD